MRSPFRLLRRSKRVSSSSGARTLRDAAREVAAEEEGGPFTILILGPGDSGKSTLMRNFRRIVEGDEWSSPSNRAAYKQLVLGDLVVGMCKPVYTKPVAPRQLDF